MWVVLADDRQIVSADDVSAGHGRYRPLMQSRWLAVRRWSRSLDPERVDWLVAAILLVGFELVIWSGSVRSDRAVAAVAAVVPCAAVVVRRRWLVKALAVGVVTSAVRLAVWGAGARAGADGVGVIAVMLVFYGAGAFYSGRRSWLAAGLGVTATLLANVGAAGSLAANVAFAAGIAVVPPFVLGRMVREHAARERASRERAERLDSQRELNVRMAALAERTRLAREIHDVIAHSVSVMVIQAAGARTVMSSEPTRAEEALQSVERAGREALAELRRLLGVLGDGRSLRELAPQPGIDDLDELVARTNAAGVTVSMRVEGRPLAVSPGLSLCAYRVIQEALTNTIKHAGPTRAEVAVRWAADQLDVAVTDHGARGRAADNQTGGGHGIVGMRERVKLHGGVLVAGPVPDGGFVVRASIPLVTQEAAA
jgi:signal transduction histidine kinase